MLVCGSGKPISSSSDVCISRAEGIECLFCKAGVAKSGPPAPMIHGALHFCVCDGYIIRVLCRRTIRHHSRIGPHLYGWFWSLAVGSVTCKTPGHSPTNALPDETQTDNVIVGCDCQGAYLRSHTSFTTARSC